tara:strand:+ start:3551 stop:4096 length:546 start_codon:yes stop_codon:yes gene_type:complete
MAGNKYRFGPNVMTVQEATNSIAQRRVVRVSPTLQAGATDSGDVAWNGTEIPNAVLRPGGCSRLSYVQVVNYSDTTCDFDILFTENTVTIGTVDAAVSITDADLKTAKLLGTIVYVDAEAQVDGINWLTSGAEVIGQASRGNLAEGILLQAAEDSTSVYFSGIDRTGADVDDLEFIFHIEY